MEHPKDIRIEDYNYPLPDERIAKYPLAERDQSKLLLFRNGKIGEDSFRNIGCFLPKGSLMVFNNTKVIQARLHFHKSTGALIEVFCLEPHTPSDYQLSFSQKGRCSWTCLVGNLKKWKGGILTREITVGNKCLTLTASRGEVSGTGHEITFEWDDQEVAFSEVLEAIGELPIPPYLNRETEESDLKTYQTVYSKIKGSVAAPTAGLHFTENVLNELDQNGVEREEITLHVGAGTFKPVKSEKIGGHEMHAEWIAVRRESIERLLAHGGHCTAVGTTSVRTLESLYYVGVLLSKTPNASQEDLHIPQWLPYEYAAAPGPKLTTTEALKEIIGYLERNQLPVLHTATQIIIAPGYKFHIVERIITNFHQPQSTLLLLVSAFIGDSWRHIYDYALSHGFRFLSYGDSSLLEPQCDKGNELLPLVNEMGEEIGSAPREECHSGKKLLHPVVHLHVFNPEGELFLQKRPEWKDIQPGKWDTAVGGHVDKGESAEEALCREAEEEIGITDFKAEFVERYVFESEREKELVHVYKTTIPYSPQPSAELDGGQFFSTKEILDRLGSHFFTPNFEQEWKKYIYKEN